MNMATLILITKEQQQYMNLLGLKANLYGIKCLLKAGCITDKEYKEKRKFYFDEYDKK